MGFLSIAIRVVVVLCALEQSAAIVLRNAHILVGNQTVVCDSTLSIEENVFVSGSLVVCPGTTVFVRKNLTVSAGGSITLGGSGACGECDRSGAPHIVLEDQARPAFAVHGSLVLNGTYVQANTTLAAVQGLFSAIDTVVDASTQSTGVVDCDGACSFTRTRLANLTGIGVHCKGDCYFQDTTFTGRPATAVTAIHVKHFGTTPRLLVMRSVTVDIAFGSALFGDAVCVDVAGFRAILNLVGATSQSTIASLTTAAIFSPCSKKYDWPFALLPDKWWPQYRMQRLHFSATARPDTKNNVPLSTALYVNLKFGRATLEDVFLEGALAYGLWAMCSRFSPNALQVSDLLISGDGFPQSVVGRGMYLYPHTSSGLDGVKGISISNASVRNMHTGLEMEGGTGVLTLHNLLIFNSTVGFVVDSAVASLSTFATSNILITSCSVGVSMNSAASRPVQAGMLAKMAICGNDWNVGFQPHSEPVSLSSIWWGTENLQKIKNGVRDARSSAQSSVLFSPASPLPLGSFPIDDSFYSATSFPTVSATPVPVDLRARCVAYELARPRPPGPGLDVLQDSLFGRATNLTGRVIVVDNGATLTIEADLHDVSKIVIGSGTVLIRPPSTSATTSLSASQPLLRVIRSAVGPTPLIEGSASSTFIARSAAFENVAQLIVSSGSVTLHGVSVPGISNSAATDTVVDLTEQGTGIFRNVSLKQIGGTGIRCRHLCSTKGVSLSSPHNFTITGLALSPGPSNFNLSIVNDLQADFPNGPAIVSTAPCVHVQGVDVLQSGPTQQPSAEPVVGVTVSRSARCTVPMVGEGWESPLDAPADVVRISRVRITRGSSSPEVPFGIRVLVSGGAESSVDKLKFQGPARAGIHVSAPGNVSFLTSQLLSSASAGVSRTAIAVSGASSVSSLFGRGPAPTNDTAVTVALPPGGVLADVTATSTQYGIRIETPGPCPPIRNLVAIGCSIGIVSNHQLADVVYEQTVACSNIINVEIATTAGGLAVFKSGFVGEETRARAGILDAYVDFSRMYADVSGAHTPPDVDRVPFGWKHDDWMDVRVSCIKNEKVRPSLPHAGNYPRIVSAGSRSLSASEQNATYIVLPLASLVVSESVVGLGGVLSYGNVSIAAPAGSSTNRIAVEFSQLHSTKEFACLRSGFGSSLYVSNADIIGCTRNALVSGGSTRVESVTVRGAAVGIACYGACTVRDTSVVNYTSYGLACYSGACSVTSSAFTESSTGGIRTSRGVFAAPVSTVSQSPSIQLVDCMIAPFLGTGVWIQSLCASAERLRLERRANSALGNPTDVHMTTDQVDASKGCPSLGHVAPPRELVVRGLNATGAGRRAGLVRVFGLPGLSVVVERVEGALAIGDGINVNCNGASQCIIRDSTLSGSLQGIGIHLAADAKPTNALIERVVVKSMGTGMHIQGGSSGTLILRDILVSLASTAFLVSGSRNAAVVFDGVFIVKSAVSMTLSIPLRAVSPSFYRTPTGQPRITICQAVSRAISFDPVPESTAPFGTIYVDEMTRGKFRTPNETADVDFAWAVPASGWAQSMGPRAGIDWSALPCGLCPTGKAVNLDPSSVRQFSSRTDTSANAQLTSLMRSGNNVCVPCHTTASGALSNGLFPVNRCGLCIGTGGACQSCTAPSSSDATSGAGFTCPRCAAGFGPTSRGNTLATPPSLASACAKCAPFFVSAGSECRSCAGNEAWRQTDAGIGECVPCPPGFIANGTHCISCPSIAIVVNGACMPCPDGSKPSSGRVTCESCPSGSAGRGGACAPCPAARVPVNNRTSCAACPPGRVARLGSAVCLACASGTTPNVARDACEPCPSTSIAPDVGTAKCTLCPKDYAANAARTVCVINAPTDVRDVAQVAQSEQAGATATTATTVVASATAATSTASAVSSVTTSASASAATVNSVTASTSAASSVSAAAAPTTSAVASAAPGAASSAGAAPGVSSAGAGASAGSTPASSAASGASSTPASASSQPNGPRGGSASGQGSAQAALGAVSIPFLQTTATSSMLSLNNAPEWYVESTAKMTRLFVMALPFHYTASPPHNGTASNSTARRLLGARDKHLPWWRRVSFGAPSSSFHMHVVKVLHGTAEQRVNSRRRLLASDASNATLSEECAALDSVSALRHGCGTWTPLVWLQHGVVRFLIHAPTNPGLYCLSTTIVFVGFAILVLVVAPLFAACMRCSVRQWYRITGESPLAAEQSPLFTVASDRVLVSSISLGIVVRVWVFAYGPLLTSAFLQITLFASPVLEPLLDADLQYSGLLLTVAFVSLVILNIGVVIFALRVQHKQFQTQEREQLARDRAIRSTAPLGRGPRLSDRSYARLSTSRGEIEMSVVENPIAKPGVRQTAQGQVGGESRPFVVEAEPAAEVPALRSVNPPQGRRRSTLDGLDAGVRNFAETGGWKRVHARVLDKSGKSKRIRTERKFFCCGSRINQSIVLHLLTSAYVDSARQFWAIKLVLREIPSAIASTLLANSQIAQVATLVVSKLVFLVVVFRTRIFKSLRLQRAWQALAITECLHAASLLSFIHPGADGAATDSVVPVPEWLRTASARVAMLIVSFQMFILAAMSVLYIISAVVAACSLCGKIKARRAKALEAKPGGSSRRMGAEVFDGRVKSVSLPPQA